MPYINALNSKSNMNFIFDLKLLKDYVLLPAAGSST